MEKTKDQALFTLTLKKGNAPGFYFGMSTVTIRDEEGSVVFKQRFGGKKALSVTLRKGNYHLSVSCLGGIWGKRIEDQLSLQDDGQPQRCIVIDAINRNYVAQCIPGMPYITTLFDYRLRPEVEGARSVRESATRRGLAAMLAGLAIGIMALAFVLALGFGNGSGIDGYPGGDIYLEGTDAFTMVTHEYAGFVLGGGIIAWMVAAGIGMVLIRIAYILRSRRKSTGINPQVRKPYCLYLRSFNSDKMTSKELSSLLKPGQTEESMLVDIFNGIAPVYAIGRPGEKYLPKGADRIYVSDVEWQQKVQEMAEDAEVILLRLGETDGFWWEVEHCFRNIDLQKLVFIIPATHNVDIISMLYAKMLTRGMIDGPMHTDISRKSKTWISGFLYFDEKNKPVFRKLKYSRLASAVIPVGEKIKQLLRPFLFRFRLEVPKKKLTQRVIAIWLALLFSVSYVAGSISLNVKRQIDAFQQYRYPQEIFEICEQIPVLQAEFAQMGNARDAKLALLVETADQGAMLLSEEDATLFFGMHLALVEAISQREAEILYDAYFQEDHDPAEFLKILLTLAKQYFDQEDYEFYLLSMCYCAQLCYESNAEMPLIDEEDIIEFNMRVMDYTPEYYAHEVPTQSDKKAYLSGLYLSGADMYKEDHARIDIIKALLICP